MKKIEKILVFRVLLLSAFLGFFYLLALIFFKQSKVPESINNLESIKAYGLGFDEIQTLRSKVFISEKFKDKMLIIHFWASWCAPCYKEFPSLLKRMKKNKKDIQLITFSLDSSLKSINDFKKKINFKEKNHISWVWDPSKKYFNQFSSEALPATYIFDKNHKLVRVILGDTDWMDKKMEVFLNQYLN